jgi:two-component system OmpR family sensor kinase
MMSRLVVSLLLITFTAIIAVGGFIDWAFSQYNEKTQHQAINIESQYGQSLANYFDASGDLKTELRAWNRTAEFPLTLLDASDLMLPPILEQQLDAEGYITLQSNEDVASYYLLRHQNKILAINRDNENNTQQTSKIIFTLVFYLLILLVLLFWLIPLLRDLRRLRTAATAYGLRDLKHRIPISPWSYTQDIHIAFNTMANKIEQLISDNKLLTNALSHELKTPIARLRFGFDVLSEEDDALKKQNYIHRINNDLNEMESIISTLLDYARLDSLDVTSKNQPFDIGPIIDDCIHAHWSQTKTIIVNNKIPLSINADPKHFCLLINNILKNALLYSDKNILVRTVLSTSHFHIYIEDDGQGVDEKEHDLIFKPFMRGNNTQGAQGHGMGLAVVARIAAWYQWDVTIGRSMQLGGAIFTIALPLATSATTK